MTRKSTVQKCANCGSDIAYTKAFRQWYHMDGRGPFCRPGAKPTQTNSYLDSPGMREAHLRSARGEW